MDRNLALARFVDHRSKGVGTLDTRNLDSKVRPVRKASGTGGESVTKIAHVPRQGGGTFRTACTTGHCWSFLGHYDNL